MFVSFPLLMFILLLLLLLLSHTYMLVYAHVYTRTCLHHSLYRASQGLSDGEIRMSLSSFVRIWQPLKEERCSLRIWKRSFRSCGCERSRKKFKQWLSRVCHGSRFGLVVNALDFNWECFLLLVTFLCWAASSNPGETLEFLFLKVKVLRLSWNFFRQQSQA